MQEASVGPVFDDRYRLLDPSEVPSPAILVYPETISANIGRAVEIAGDPARMRPHVKTHKTVELVRMELAAGITKHKCATLAEAEMLAVAGARDVLLAYPLVGPNVARFARLQAAFPGRSFQALVDHPDHVAALAAGMQSAGQRAEVLIDLDVGMGRTGISLAEAPGLYRQIARAPSLVLGGLHLYDGHNHQHDLAERTAAVGAIWTSVRGLAEQLEAAGLCVPRIVAGNSATFPCWARLADAEPRIESSPGTVFLNDWNYSRWFRDLGFPPAACLLTRVISRPRPGRLTLDLGYKAVASDAPLERRLHLPELPDAKIVLQNEEHLVLETSAGERLGPGAVLYAWPAHICPTCALHQELYAVVAGRVVARWAVASRDRRITV